MKKILLTACALAMFTTTNTASADEYKYEAGVHFSFPVYGLSVKKNLSKTSAVQAVISTGLLDGLHGRYIHKFTKTKTKKLYLQSFVYAQAGVMTLGQDDGYGMKEDVIPYHVGAGAGLEYVNPQFSDKLKYTIEAGFKRVEERGEDSFTSLNFGTGFHYAFGD